MAGEKVIKLLGMRHDLEHIKDTEKVLEEQLKPGQSVGLEVTPEILKKIEKYLIIQPGPGHEWHVFSALFALVKQKGATIKPLDSEYAMSRLTAFGSALKPKKLQETIRSPARERFMASRIIQFKPDFAVIGADHLKEVDKLLRKEGIKTRIIYREKTIESSFEKKLRSEYWQRRKQRERMRLGLKKRI